MSNRTPTNIAASVLAKLRNLALQRGWNYMHMVTRYGIERFLFRLGTSEYAKAVCSQGRQYVRHLAKRQQFMPDT